MLLAYYSLLLNSALHLLSVCDSVYSAYRTGATRTGVTVTGMATNDVIRTQVVRNYRQFVAEVDPRGGIMDHLIEAGVVSIETKERIVSHVTRQV